MKYKRCQRTITHMTRSKKLDHIEMFNKFAKRDVGESWERGGREMKEVEKGGRDVRERWEKWERGREILRRCERELGGG